MKGVGSSGRHSALRNPRSKLAQIVKASTRQLARSPKGASNEPAYASALL